MKKKHTMSGTPKDGSVVDAENIIVGCYMLVHEVHLSTKAVEVWDTRRREHGVVAHSATSVEASRRWRTRAPDFLFAKMHI
uniref:Uncharacterized protein n=1 Tax=Oryza brachyantha TaxID=4533 RepID=J3MRZ2_ORYBR